MVGKKRIEQSRRIPYSDNELMQVGRQRTLRGEELNHIAFPLGGIGTGMISVGGWGQLCGWEIMNRPRKGFIPQWSFFMVKADDGKNEPSSKVLQGPSGAYLHNGGDRAHSYCGEGLPHFRNASFKGSYPFANVELWDEGFPLRARLEAFNPFIPLNDRDSGIPVAILRYHLKNTSNRKLKATIYGNLRNFIGDNDGRINKERSENGLKGLEASTAKHAPDSPLYGTMVLAGRMEGMDVWPRWDEDKNWLNRFWRATALSDVFPPQGSADIGSVAVRGIELGQGETKTVTFLIAWHFPNYGHPIAGKCGCGKEEREYVTWKNYYATIWRDAWDVARYTADNLERLYDETLRFHDSLFSSTLPRHVLDAVSSQTSILKTTTCLRLTDGTFYGFEGCNENAGCCPGSCSHVWNYAQALPYLFPRLQRSMLEAVFKNNLLEDGFMGIRMPLPLGTKTNRSFLPCADGQMGFVLQVYREWQLSGDDEWMHRLWPSVKKALEFAWKYWDSDRDGMMEGMQHNTYDIEFHGANTMTGSLYLGALKAGAKMARRLGEKKAAKEYERILAKGSKKTDAELFNGEYYEQKVNPDAAKAWSAKHREAAEKNGKDDVFDWPKWQYGKGCLSDQMIGQWYASMLGLGYLYDRGNIRKALAAVFRHNWKNDLTDVPCFHRLYALNEESGLLTATWPRGGKPGYPLNYASEVWTGIEYQVASHLIYEGMLPEALAIVKGARNRYSGERRNPWDEVECGHHYARAMSSYAILLALGGFSYSGTAKRICFAPRMRKEKFRTFFSVASGWGVYGQKKRKNEWRIWLRIEYGELKLRTAQMELGSGNGGKISARLGRRIITGTRAEITDGILDVVFPEEIIIGAGETLITTISRENEK